MPTLKQNSAVLRLLCHVSHSAAIRFIARVPLIPLTTSQWEGLFACTETIRNALGLVPNHAREDSLRLVEWTDCAFL
jgi:hypothetical protein